MTLVYGRSDTPDMLSLLFCIQSSLVLTSILIPLSTLHVLSICPNLLIHSFMSPTESQAKIPRHHLIPLFLPKKDIHAREASNYLCSIFITNSPITTSRRKSALPSLSLSVPVPVPVCISLSLSLLSISPPRCYPFIRLFRIVRCRTYIIYLTRSSQFNSKDEKVPVAVTYEKATVCLQVYCI